MAAACIKECVSKKTHVDHLDTDVHPSENTDQSSKNGLCVLRPQFDYTLLINSSYNKHILCFLCFYVYY